MPMCELYNLLCELRLDVEKQKGTHYDHMKRLDKMEDIVSKMLENQQHQAVNIAQICQATNANCSSGN